MFRNFCELAAIAVRNCVDIAEHERRDKRYLEVAAHYSSEELRGFATGLGMLALQFTEGFSDALGDLYMSLELGKDRLGQFLTPKIWTDCAPPSRWVMWSTVHGNWDTRLPAFVSSTQ